VRIIPLRVIHGISGFLGDLLYLFMKERRMIAVENVRNALGNEKSEEEIKTIGRRSCRSFILTCLEIIRFQHVFTAKDASEVIRRSSREVETLLQKVKKTHEESGGCIFVTPHIGNWEFLPHVGSILGIPLVSVARPLDNPYLERLVYKRRTDTGQILIAKKNAFLTLQRMLQQGKSIGMLPDQSTQKGIPVNFFGRKAATTPVPALLSIRYKRPIVVVACCRGKNGYDFEGIVSDPIWPGTYESEKEEIFRLTEEMNRKIEGIIRRYPDQYFWIHNRWKTYRSGREIFQ
jgi:KDO2-lipid IV(A) lauroyltransferase